MRRLILALLLLSAPAAAQTPTGDPAAPQVLMCRLRDSSGTGWVPDFLMLTRRTAGPDSGRIEVFDPILQTLVHRPVQAVMTRDGWFSRSYGWALGGVRNQSGQYADRLDYRLTVRKADGAATLAVTASGYGNVMRGRGLCASPQG